MYPYWILIIICKYFTILLFPTDSRCEDSEKEDLEDVFTKDSKLATSKVHTKALN